MDDIYYLRRALANAQKSYEQGNFPAGAVVVQNDNIIAEAVSSPYPGLLHADSKAVSAAFEKYGRLENATLYVSMESCLMCTGVAFWGGIRRIVYAIPKSKLSPLYYETGQATRDLVAGFNEKIELVAVRELENEAMAIVQAWEKHIKPAI